ncbi:MAG: ribose 5-phosphate isomerase B [Defluviitaleaceae bacterium]|nr:ribose 5-phosphate isomerase B [Defluviitaleaceae bacterium]
MTLKVAIAGDHGGFELKQKIVELLESLNMTYEDFGCYTCGSVDYPDYAFTVGSKVAAGEFDRGILICGTGVGISIAANKVKGVRCALVHDVFTAKATRQHNDSNVLAMGGRVIGDELAKMIVQTWLGEAFMGEHHANRLDKIAAYEGNESN